jgi:hypothetical protein
MLFLFVSVILFGLSLCGSGCLFGRLFGYSSPRNPWIYFWLGFFIISSLSMLVSLFVPVNLISLIIFFIIGVTGLPFFYREYKKATAQYGSVEVKIFIFIAFLTVVVITSFGAYTSWPGWAYDTDLYHAQVIRWYNEYGTPPGLGNLHTRLASNSSWHSLAALFDNGIWDSRSAWIMPALSLFGGILYCLFELIFSKRNGTRLYALCILAWVGLKITDGAANPALYYDTPVHIVNAVIILEAYYILSGYTRNLSKKEIHNSANLLMLSVSAFMIKPIGAVSLLFSGLLTLFLLVRNTKQTVSSWVIVYTPALCAFAVWVIKNLFLSGYPLYPMPVFAMPFDWTMPFGSVNSYYLDVVAWARMPGPGYRQSLENGFWFWFKPWLTGYIKSKAFLVLAVFPSSLSPLLWFFVAKYVKIKKALYFFVWTLLSIFYWFMTAPDLRFGDGFFWVWLGAAFLFLTPDGLQFKIVNLWKNPKILITIFYFFVLYTVYMVGRTAFAQERDLLSIGSIPPRPVKEYIVDTPPPPLYIGYLLMAIVQGILPFPVRLMRRTTLKFGNREI